MIRCRESPRKLMRQADLVFWELLHFYSFCQVIFYVTMPNFWFCRLNARSKLALLRQDYAARQRRFQSFALRETLDIGLDFLFWAVLLSNHFLFFTIHWHAAQFQTTHAFDDMAEHLLTDYLLPMEHQKIRSNYTQLRAPSTFKLQYKAIKSYRNNYEQYSTDIFYQITICIEWFKGFTLIYVHPPPLRQGNRPSNTSTHSSFKIQPNNVASAGRKRWNP